MKSRKKKLKAPRMRRTETEKVMRRHLAIVDNGAPDPSIRPKTLGDCKGHEGPCPFVGCKANLYLEADKASPRIRYNFPKKQPWQVKYSCSFVEADRGGLTLEEVADRLDLTRERVRQIEQRAMNKFLLAAAAAGIVLGRNE